MPQEMSALLISTARYLIDLHLMRRDSKSYITFEFRFYFYDSWCFPISPPDILRVAQGCGSPGLRLTQDDSPGLSS